MICLISDCAGVVFAKGYCQMHYTRLLRHGDPLFLSGHKDVGSREYIAWASMLSRCTNSKNEQFKNYGGRGIRVCARWRSYKNFLSDMGRKPSPKHTLERTDTNADYCPTNCKWATQIEQQRNRRNNRLIEVNGRKVTLAEAAQILGIPRSTLWNRLDRGITIKGVNGAD